MQQPDAVEVAVGGRPDELRGDVVAAFVAPVADASRGDALRDAIMHLVREPHPDWRSTDDPGVAVVRPTSIASRYAGESEI